ncbi:hypothetical protein [Haloparvum sp. PAK95]|uniref:hypothetical protein n=1 Tax=Haloparvum sp. PAK95 TaxID=3418962 RepID=UPI003D2EA5BC
MILNLLRTISELGDYLDKIHYPWVRMIVYFGVSIVTGVLLSNSPNAEKLPILTLTAILFGFTINAVVMLGNSSEHYLSETGDHRDQLKHYYKKALHISIHTLGIGIITIVAFGLFQLFPGLNVTLTQMTLLGYTVEVGAVSSVAYSLTVYYLMMFSTVVASTAELVKIRI